MKKALDITDNHEPGGEQEEAAKTKEKPRGKRKSATFRCVECLHCKIFKETAPSGRYVLKCRCAKGVWRNGKRELTCDMHMVGYRRRKSCEHYVSTSEDEGDRERYLKSLDDFLPIERYVYHPDGSFVDMTEKTEWD